MTNRAFKSVNGKRFPSVTADHAPFTAIVYVGGNVAGEKVSLGDFPTFYAAANAAARHDFEHNNGARGCAVIPQGGRHGGTVPHPVFYTTKPTTADQQ